MELKRVLAGATIAVLAATGLTACGSPITPEAAMKACKIDTKHLTGKEIKLLVVKPEDETTKSQVSCLLDQIGAKDLSIYDIEQPSIRNNAAFFDGWQVLWEKHAENEGFFVKFFRSDDHKYQKWERKDTRLERVAMQCKLPDAVKDDGHSLIIKGAKKYTDVDKSFNRPRPAITVEDLGCLLVAADTPESVISRMSSTRALDGTQSASWDGITATWNYHPDSGFSLILESSE